MNLNQSISLSDLNPSKFLPVVLRYQKWIITLVITGLLGYTTYQLSLVVAVPPAPAYTAGPTTKLPSLRFQPTTIKQLKALQNPGSTTPNVPIGKQDPFAE